LSIPTVASALIAALIRSRRVSAMSPVRRVVQRAFADAGHQSPANPARHLLMLRGGAAVTSGYLDSATAAQRNCQRSVDGLL
jgi:hypothetical protein